MGAAACPEAGRQEEMSMTFAKIRKVTELKGSRVIHRITAFRMTDQGISFSKPNTSAHLDLWDSGVYFKGCFFSWRMGNTTENWCVFRQHFYNMKTSFYVLN